MRTRLAVLVPGLILGLAATVSACGGSAAPGVAAGSPAQTPTASGTTINCSRFVGTAEHLAQTQTKVYRGAQSPAAAAVLRLSAQLSALLTGDPLDVAAAAEDLTAGFTEVLKLRAHPNSVTAARIEALRPRLDLDGRKINSYVALRCV
jgi:hypothetical protein